MADFKVKRVETFRAFVQRVAPEHAHIILQRETDLHDAGEALADAVRGLDSYAASTQVAPLERSQRADAALAAWSRVAFDEGRP